MNLAMIHAEVVMYQAEDGDVIGRAQKFDTPSPAHVGIGDTKGNGVEWDDVEVPSVGSYKVTLRYAGGGGVSRPMELMVNNERKATFRGSDTGGSTKYRTEDHMIDLFQTGTVTFKLTAMENAGPNVDFLALEYVGSGGGGVGPSTGGGSGQAGSTVGQKHDGHNKYFITRTAIIPKATFSDNDSEKTPTAEVELQFDVSEERLVDDADIKIKALTLDCGDEKDPVVADAVDILTEEEDHPTNNLLKRLTVGLDVDTASVYGSNIFTPDKNSDGTESKTHGTVNVCVQVDVLEPEWNKNVPVSQTKTKMSFKLELDDNFDVVKMDALKVLDDKTSSDAVVNYEIVACVCNPSATGDKPDCIHDADDPPPDVQINSMLALCVYSDSKAVQVWDVADFDLKQSLKPMAGTYLYEAVDSFKENPLTELDWEYDNDIGWWVMMKTPFVSPFFNQKDQTTPEPIEALGDVMLAFRQNGDSGKTPGTRTLFLRSSMSPRARMMASKEEDIKDTDNAGLHEFHTMINPKYADAEDDKKKSGGSTPSTALVAVIASLLAFML